MPNVKVDVADLALNQTVMADTPQGRLLFCRLEGGVKAMPEMCPHQTLSLEGARVRRGSLFCPHHGARFSMEDGKSMSPLTNKPLHFYPVREVEPGLVEVEL